MGNLGILVVSSIVLNLGLTGTSTAVIGSGSILSIQYVVCSFPIAGFSISRPSYIQVI